MDQESTMLREINQPEKDINIGTYQLKPTDTDTGLSPAHQLSQQPDPES